jgi:hypothetical protein
MQSFALLKRKALLDYHDFPVQVKGRDRDIEMVPYSIEMIEQDVDGVGRADLLHSQPAAGNKM